MGKEPKLIWVYIGLVGVAAIWGSSFVAGKYAVGLVPPITFAALRFLVASVLLLPLLFGREGRQGIMRLREVPGFFFLSLTGIFVYNLFFFYGLQDNPAGLSSLVVSANPVLINLLAALFLGERLRVSNALGLGLAVAGVFLVLGGADGRVHLSGLLEPRRFLLYGAAACWALYTLGGRILLRGMTPLKVTTWSSLLGGVLLAATGVWHDGVGAVLKVSLAGWLLAGYFAVFVTLLAFLWYYRGVAILGAGRASVFITLLPITALGLSALVYRETLSDMQALGALAIVGGLFLVVRPRGSKA